MPIKEEKSWTPLSTPTRPHDFEGTGKYRVLITFRVEHTHNLKEYPLCVCVIGPDGKRHQDIQARSIREARINANGICYAGCFMGRDAGWPVSPELDRRLEDAVS
jgi:hypothetical protein